MQLEQINANEGITNITLENKSSDYIFTWNSSQLESSFLIVIQYEQSLISGRNIQELLSGIELPRENDWFDDKEKSIKIHRLSTYAYLANKGITIQKKIIPSPAKVMFFYLKGNETLLFHDDESNCIPFNKTIFYQIKKPFCLNIFSQYRKYLVSFEFDGKSAAVLNGLINCEVAGTKFPLTKRCLNEKFEIIANRSTPPKPTIAENLKQYYNLQEERK